MSLFSSIKRLTTGIASKNEEEEAKMRFALTPGETGFSQWLDAMKMVAQLPGGMPPEFRTKLWLQLSEKHFQDKNIDWPREEKLVFSEWSNPDDEELGVQIVKDLHRTGCSLFCGPEGEQNQALLKRVLLAYARWNKSVGYCQGFNMLAALILQVMDRDEKNAVKVMIYLIDSVLPESYFANNLRGLSVDMAVFRDLMKTRLPKLSRHLDALQQDTSSGNNYEPPLTNVFTMQWFLTLFSNCLPQPTVLRVWDLVFLYGNEVLLRTALAIWGILQERVISVESADEFYSIMGVVTREMLEFGLMDANNLIKTIVMVDPFHSELQELRDKYLYNISPWTQSVQTAAKRGFRLFHSDNEDQDDTEDEATAKALAAAYGVFRRRDSTSSRDVTPAGPTLDISVLKQQYAKLLQRQRQAHVIISAACTSSVGGSSVSVNQLLAGKSALIGKGRRIGPPEGSVPTSSPYNRNPGKKAKVSISGETLHWRDISGDSDDVIEPQKENVAHRTKRKSSVELRQQTNHNRNDFPRSHVTEKSVDDSFKKKEHKKRNSSSSSSSTELCDDEFHRFSDIDSEDTSDGSGYQIPDLVLSPKVHNEEFDELFSESIRDVETLTENIDRDDKNAEDFARARLCALELVDDIEARLQTCERLKRADVLNVRKIIKTDSISVAKLPVKCYEQPNSQSEPDPEFYLRSASSSKAPHLPAMECTEMKEEDLFKSHFKLRSHDYFKEISSHEHGNESLVPQNQAVSYSEKGAKEVSKPAVEDINNLAASIEFPNIGKKNIEESYFRHEVLGATVSKELEDLSSGRENQMPRKFVTSVMSNEEIKEFSIDATFSDIIDETPIKITNSAVQVIANKNYDKLVPLQNVKVISDKDENCSNKQLPTTDAGHYLVANHLPSDTRQYSEVSSKLSKTENQLNDDRTDYYNLNKTEPSKISSPILEKRGAVLVGEEHFPVVSSKIAIEHKVETKTPLPGEKSKYAESSQREIIQENFKQMERSRINIDCDEPFVPTTDERFQEKVESKDKSSNNFSDSIRNSDNISKKGVKTEISLSGETSHRPSFKTSPEEKVDETVEQTERSRIDLVNYGEHSVPLTNKPLQEKVKSNDKLSINLSDSIRNTDNIDEESAKTEISSSNRKEKETSPKEMIHETAKQKERSIIDKGNNGELPFLLTDKILREKVDSKDNSSKLFSDRVRNTDSIGKEGVEIEISSSGKKSMCLETSPREMIHESDKQKGPSRMNIISHEELLVPLTDKPLQKKVEIKDTFSNSITNTGDIGKERVETEIPSYGKKLTYLESSHNEMIHETVQEIKQSSIDKGYHGELNKTLSDKSLQHEAEITGKSSGYFSENITTLDIIDKPRVKAEVQSSEEKSICLESSTKEMAKQTKRKRIEIGELAKTSTDEGLQQEAKITGESSIHFSDSIRNTNNIDKYKPHVHNVHPEVNQLDDFTSGSNKGNSVNVPDTKVEGLTEENVKVVGVINITDRAITKSVAPPECDQNTHELTEEGIAKESRKAKGDNLESFRELEKEINDQLNFLKKYKEMSTRTHKVSVLSPLNEKSVTDKGVASQLISEATEEAQRFTDNNEPKVPVKIGDTEDNEMSCKRVVMARKSLSPRRDVTAIVKPNDIFHKIESSKSQWENKMQKIAELDSTTRAKLIELKTERREGSRFRGRSISPSISRSPIDQSNVKPDKRLRISTLSFDEISTRTAKLLRESSIVSPEAKRPTDLGIRTSRVPAEIILNDGSPIRDVTFSLSSDLTSNKSDSSPILSKDSKISRTMSPSSTYVKPKNATSKFKQLLEECYGSNDEELEYVKPNPKRYQAFSSPTSPDAQFKTKIKYSEFVSPRRLCNQKRRSFAVGNEEDYLNIFTENGATSIVLNDSKSQHHYKVSPSISEHSFRDEFQKRKSTQYSEYFDKVEFERTSPLREKVSPGRYQKGDSISPQKDLSRGPSPSWRSPQRTEPSDHYNLSLADVRSCSTKTRNDFDTSPVNLRYDRHSKFSDNDYLKQTDDFTTHSDNLIPTSKPETSYKMVYYPKEDKWRLESQDAMSEKAKEDIKNSPVKFKDTDDSRYSALSPVDRYKSSSIGNPQYDSDSRYRESVYDVSSRIRRTPSFDTETETNRHFYSEESSGPSSSYDVERHRRQPSFTPFPPRSPQKPKDIAVRLGLYPSTDSSGNTGKSFSPS